MDKKIEKILNDIYMVDESLKEKEKDIIKIIEELLRSKPDAKIDRNFVAELRNKLMARAKTGKARSENSIFLGIFDFKNKLAYSLLGMIIAVIALAPIFFYQNIDFKKDLAENNSSKNTDENFSVTRIADNAFGSFLPEKIQKSGAGGGLGIGGGGGSAINSAGSDAAQKQSAMPIYETVNYRYIYKGEGIQPLENKLSVYARIKNNEMKDNLTGIFQGMNISLLDISKLENLNVNNISFSEDREYGYDVTLSPLDGSVSMYMNWLKWPDPYASCRDNACSEDINLKLSDIPEDSVILSMSDSFLDYYGISKSSYGAGKVIKSYMDPYARPLAAGSDIFVSDNISVVYPLVIDGKSVYDSSGELDGMFVDVNIRYKKVSGARNIYFQDFQSSAYDAETDVRNIVSYAEKGGLYGDYAYENPSRTVDVELGDPSMELVKIWKYNEGKRMGEEFYVPSLIFPITNKPEGYFYRKNVIVPLVKEMLSDIRGAIIQSGGSLTK